MNIDQWIADQRSRFPDFDEESARQMASMPFYAMMLGIDPPIRFSPAASGRTKFSS
jgi:hypothetical protein